MLEDEHSRSFKVEHVEPLPQIGGITNKQIFHIEYNTA